MSLTKEKYNYCSRLVIIIGETPPGAGAGAVAEAEAGEFKGKAGGGLGLGLEG